MTSERHTGSRPRAQRLTSVESRTCKGKEGARCVWGKLSPQNCSGDARPRVCLTAAGTRRKSAPLSGGGSGPPSSPCSASSRSCDGDLKARSSAGGSASPQRRFGVTGSDRPLTDPPLGLLEPEARSRTACVRGGTPLLLGLALLGSRTGFGIRYRDLDASLAPREAAGAREESRGRWRNGWV